MALVDTTWYVNAGDQSTTGHYAVAKRVSGAAVVAGQLVRQFTAPTVGNERVFVCIVAGTVAVATDATWVLTRGAKTVDGTATWMECTGQAALNGDLTNTQTWAAVKAATPAVLGQIIKRSNNASYQICTTAGAMSASEPTFSDTAGVTTTDTTAVWTSLGVVGNFTGGQAPHARLANVYGTSWATVGNTVYVGDNHAESQASTITIAFIGSSAGLINKVFCHNHSGSYPPVSGDLMTGATITTTGINNLTVIFYSTYIYGIAFRCGVGSAGTTLLINPGSTINNQAWFCLENCSIEQHGTGSGSIIQLGSGSNSQPSVIILKNTTMRFGHTGQYIGVFNSRLIWQGTGTILVSGSTVPTILFGQSASTNNVFSIELEAIDLSQITSSIVNEAIVRVGTYLIKDCKLNVAATNATPLHTSTTIQLVRSSA